MLVGLVESHGHLTLCRIKLCHSWRVCEDSQVSRRGSKAVAQEKETGLYSRGSVSSILNKALVFRSLPISQTQLWKVTLNRRNNYMWDCCTCVQNIPLSLIPLTHPSSLIPLSSLSLSSLSLIPPLSHPSLIHPSLSLSSLQEELGIETDEDAGAKLPPT